MPGPSPAAYRRSLLLREYKLNPIPRGTHDYANFLRPWELQRWAHGAGLEVAGMKGLHYNRLLKTTTVNDDVSVNYLLHCRKAAP